MDVSLTPFFSLKSANKNFKIIIIIIIIKEMFKPVENVYDFISAQVTISGKENLNSLRRCSGECQFYSLFYPVESKEEM